jgi:hypothetical protein
MTMTSEFEQFIGTTFRFDDGAEITIVQIKRRDDGFWVTYETVFPRCLPRRLVMPERDFIETYGHLFV